MSGAVGSSPKSHFAGPGRRDVKGVTREHGGCVWEWKFEKVAVLKGEDKCVKNKILPWGGTGKAKKASGVGKQPQGKEGRVQCSVAEEEGWVHKPWPGQSGPAVLQEGSWA